MALSTGYRPRPGVQVTHKPTGLKARVELLGRHRTIRKALAVAKKLLAGRLWRRRNPLPALPASPDGIVRTYRLDDPHANLDDHLLPEPAARAGLKP